MPISGNTVGKIIRDYGRRSDIGNKFLQETGKFYCTSNRFAVIDYNERPPAILLPYAAL